MKRMITNEQVVDVVNKAIDDGEIEVGGLPEIEEGDAGKVLKVNEQEDGVEWGKTGGADNALVLPESAPASASAVIIDTNNTQQNIRLNTNSIDLYTFGDQTRLTTKCGLHASADYYATIGNYDNQTVPAGKIRCVLIAKGLMFAVTATRGLWNCKDITSVSHLEKDIQALETAGLTIMGFINGAGTTRDCNELYAVVKNSTENDITVNLTGYHMYECRGLGFGI